MNLRTLQAVDLFCGAGGTSTGAMKAARAAGAQLNLLAVNHWPTAINSHTLNHPSVRHLCESLDNIRPQVVVPGGQLDLLMASPECTHHSNAAGGRPRNDQSRATAWHICRWAADLSVQNIIIENVREFQHWGPLTKLGKPMKRRKGETFKAFINTLRGMGFTVEYRVVNAANYGDPTSRLRLVILARRGKPIIWPEPTHGAGQANPWRTAREVIDWGIKGQSIFGRKKSLAPNTIRRIAAGLKKFGGVNADPFLVILNGTAAGQIQHTAKSVDKPLPTLATCGHIGLAEPFIVTMEHQGSERNIDRPLPTITTARGGAMGVVEPFITHLTHHGERKQHSIDEPCPTITGAHRGELGLIEPFLVKFHGDHAGREDGAQRVHAADQPLPTLDTSNRFGLCEPFIVKYYGTGRAESINEPLDTVTSKDRIMLVEPKSGKIVAELDILFRMLQPHELA